VELEGEAAGPAMEGQLMEETSDEDISGVLEKRECPIPKPRGVVGEILGFKSSSSGRGSKPP